MPLKGRNCKQDHKFDSRVCIFTSQLKQNKKDKESKCIYLENQLVKIYSNVLLARVVLQIIIIVKITTYTYAALTLC